MDPLLKSDCPISIFFGLGGHGLSFFHFGAVIAHIVLTHVIFHVFKLNYHPPLLDCLTFTNSNVLNSLKTIVSTN